jgi:hypothetical protein
MEKMIEMGFKEGFTMSMTNLESLLATLSKPVLIAIAGGMIRESKPYHIIVEKQRDLFSIE